MISACVLLLASCTTELYADLDQKQANEIVATLFRNGIPAKRVVEKSGRYTIQVSEESFPQAVAILNQAGLPRQEFTNLGEVFKNDGLVASPVQERAQMIYALSQELARTVSDIDGVLTARVHLVLPENDPLRQQLIPSSASVFIRHKQSVPMADLVPQVKMLVANGIAGLSYDNVSVVHISVSTPDNELEMSAEPQLENFLGIWIHPESVNKAQWMAYGLAGVLAACIALFGFAFWGRRQQIYPLVSQARGETQ